RLGVRILAAEGDVEVVAVVGDQRLGGDRRGGVVARIPLVGQGDDGRVLPRLFVQHAVDLDRRGGPRDLELAPRRLLLRRLRRRRLILWGGWGDLSQRAEGQREQQGQRQPPSRLGSM